MATPPRITRSMVEEALAANGGNVSAAAENLGVSRRGFYDRMEAFSIDPEAFRSVTFSAEGAHIGDHFTVRSGVQHGSDVHTSSDAKWQDGKPETKFRAIMRQVGEAVGTAVQGAVDDLGAAMERRNTPPPMRLKRAEQDWVHAVRRKVNAEWNDDLTGSDLLEMIVRWAREKGFAEEMLAKDRRYMPLSDVSRPRGDGK